MNAKELFQLGHLSEAVTELTKEVKAQPSDPHLRSFLFELLCFQGDYDRAAKQLSAIPTLTGKMETELGAALYANLLHAERLRRDFFHGSGLPKFLMPPPQYVERYVVMIRRIGKEPLQAEALLSEAEDATPVISGRACDKDFASFRDGDDRLAPILEVFQGADYLWLPFEQIKRLELSPPKRLRDLIWTNARIETSGGALNDVFIPVMYPDSHLCDDEEVKLGRKTEWRLLGERLVYGQGQRAFLVDDQELSLLQVQSAEFKLVNPAP
jgi:type VI secretion system protein ImpE